MCSAAGGAAGAQGAAGVMGAYSQYQQGKMNEKYYSYLANQSEKQADKVDEATAEQLSVINANAGRDIADVKKSGNLTVASQKAAMAANGVYSDSGTAGDIIGDSIDKQALDEAAIKYNADQAMWSTKRNSINQKTQLYAEQASYRIQGSNARASGNMNAMGTLVGSAASAGSTYASIKTAGQTTK